MSKNIEDMELLLTILYYIVALVLTFACTIWEAYKKCEKDGKNLQERK